MTPLVEDLVRQPATDDNLIRLRQEMTRLAGLRDRIVQEIRKLYRVLDNLKSKKEITEADLSTYAAREMAEIKTIGADIFKQFAEMKAELSARSLNLTRKELSLAGLDTDQDKREAFLLKETRHNALEEVKLSTAWQDVATARKSAHLFVKQSQEAQIKAVELRQEAFRLFTLRKNQFDDQQQQWKERSKALAEREKEALVNARKIKAVAEAVEKEKQRLEIWDKQLKDKEGTLVRSARELEKQKANVI
jgi:hypothetical protein